MCNGNCSGKTGDTTGANSRSKEEINAFYDGLIEGVHMYAWWEDGIQNVGTTGKTYRTALKEIEAERQAALGK